MNKAENFTSESGSYPSFLANLDNTKAERQLINAGKRGGARTFGPHRFDFDSFFYPTDKRQETFSPYYFYQQPKRGGGRGFYSVWNPPTISESRNLPFILTSPIIIYKSGFPLIWDRMSFEDKIIGPTAPFEFHRLFDILKAMMLNLNLANKFLTILSPTRIT
ncbi:unnamed protein product [Dracunculus medinensis]|uniref:Uncharacterized protein n=1 Tax=Dracunculus medinensis TaxID=318479 RepID=A0A0N4UI29_DRAME|nr:unnamed protein product [Dracunculus medinensis]